MIKKVAKFLIQLFTNNWFYGYHRVAFGMSNNNKTITHETNFNPFGNVAAYSAS